MLSSVNSTTAGVLEALSQVDRVNSLAPEFSAGWHESVDRSKGRFESKWMLPSSWENVILQGPYFHVGNPFASERNATMRSNRDYSPLDLEVLARDAIPFTEYQPIYGEAVEADGLVVASTREYDSAYDYWELNGSLAGREKLRVPARASYRLVWRKMASLTGERTFISAIYPPGTAHIEGVLSFGFPASSGSTLPLVAAGASSLIADFFMRATVGANIQRSEAFRLPIIPFEHPLAGAAILRALRLNSLTEAYAEFWKLGFSVDYMSDSWAGGVRRMNRPALAEVETEWSMASPLRIDEDRRQALVEIDAIMAIVTGISIDDLVTIYRTQFGVLNDYDRGEGKKAYIYDANGRQIPSSVRSAWNKAGRPETGLPLEERTAVHPSATGTGRTIVYEQPFRILDREADMRQAYAEFTRRMEENGS